MVREIRDENPALPSPPEIRSTMMAAFQTGTYSVAELQEMFNWPRPIIRGNLGVLARRGKITYGGAPSKWTAADGR